MRDKLRDKELRKSRESTDLRPCVSYSGRERCNIEEWTMWLWSLDLVRLTLTLSSDNSHRASLRAIETSRKRIPTREYACVRACVRDPGPGLGAEAPCKTIYIRNTFPIVTSWSMRTPCSHLIQIRDIAVNRWWLAVSQGCNGARVVNIMLTRYLTRLEFWYFAHTPR